MEENTTILDRINSFIDRRKDIIERDLGDLKVSRSFSSGFGFTEEDRELRGKKGRAEITANVMRPWITKVVNDYDNNPFSLSARRYDGMDASAVGNVLDYESEESDVADVCSMALQDVLNDGYAYVLVDVATNGNGEQYSNPVILDNGRVFFDHCDNPTGADCQMAVYLDLIRKDTAESRYGINMRMARGVDDPFSSISYYGSSSSQYTTIATVYEMTDSGCEITTLVHGRQVGETRTIPGCSRLPIVRFAGERIWLETKEEWVYRGAYWYVFDLVRTINFTMSLQAERIATNPTTKFLSAKGAFAGQSGNLVDLNKNPKLYAEYNRFDETGREIPAPIPFPVDKDNSDLMSVVERTNAMVMSILGSPSGEAPANETAEAVLLKRNVQEATVSRFLKSARESMEEVGKIMLEMMPVLFGSYRITSRGHLLPVMSVEGYYIAVDSGPIAQSQKQRVTGILMAISKLVQENPGNPVLPAIIRNTELPENEKAELMQRLGSGQNPAATEQAIQQAQQQSAQMAAQLQEAEKTISALQIQLNAMMDDTVNKYRIAQLDAQTKLQIKAMELAADNQAQHTKIMADAALQQQEAVMKIEAERAKAIASAPAIPVFDKGRFV